MKVADVGAGIVVLLFAAGWRWSTEAYAGKIRAFCKSRS